ncbi:GNAT family N-acetyltransferase [Oceanospirillaceae bacterium]|nr:GNAT family N-acetyltransferase [Oceanospirillaceae bacterium]
MVLIDSRFRIAIRPFLATDSERVQMLVSNAAVTQMAGNIPYPYPEHGAQTWIASHGAQHRSGTAIIRAIVSVATNQCIGAISIDQITRGLNASGNLGYWVGEPYWNQGFCAQAGQLMLQLATTEYAIKRVVAAHRVDNIASGKVLKKLGFNELKSEYMTNFSGQYLFRCYEKML